MIDKPPPRGSAAANAFTLINANAATTAMNIRDIRWTTAAITDKWVIKRGAVIVATLYGNGHWDLSGDAVALEDATDAATTLDAELTGAGFIAIKLGKS